MTDTDHLSELRLFLSSKSIPNGQFKFSEVSPDKMKLYIAKLKGKKSCGMDWIYGYSLKLTSKLLSEELRFLINLSLKTQAFSSQWKKTKVLPGFKHKGSKFDAKFYRPISNISEISKLVELAVYDQVYEYLSKNNLIHPNHHGFLSNHSTATALQQLVDLWMLAADQQKLSSRFY